VEGSSGKNLTIGKDVWEVQLLAAGRKELGQVIKHDFGEGIVFGGLLGEGKKNR